MKKTITAAFIVAISSLFLLSSFVAPTGGDYFEIYLNSKRIHEQAVHADKTVHTLDLSNARPSDEVRVTYSHCGKLGMDRKILIKDSKDLVLREWKYANGTSTSKYLTFKIADVTGLKKSDNVIKIVYVSRELPEGFVVARAKTGMNSVAKK